MVRQGLLWLAVALYCQAAVAAGPLKLKPGMGGVADIGSTPCAIFNEMHYNGPTGMQHNVLTWLEGYLYATTGEHIDSLLAKQQADWDFDSLSAVFVDYCRTNPEDEVAQAAIHLAGELGV